MREWEACKGPRADLHESIETKQNETLSLFSALCLCMTLLCVASLSADPTNAAHLSLMLPSLCIFEVPSQSTLCIRAKQSPKYIRKMANVCCVL
jgi:hypothetical protein